MTKVHRSVRLSAHWASTRAGVALSFLLLAGCSTTALEDATRSEPSATTSSRSALVKRAAPGALSGRSLNRVAGSLALPAPTPTDDESEGGECQPARPLPRNRCNPEEPAPPPPPVAGECDIDILAEWLQYEEGQGGTEGAKAEGSVTYTLTDGKTGDVVTARFPESGSYKLPEDSEYTLNAKLATYTVKENKQRDVQICATFREHDGDVIDINGDDDVGTTCETFTLTCPQQSDSELMYADLCRGGDCDKLKGAMSTSVKALAADADRDCVDNEDDYTPEPCDEAWKGQQCRASLVYFYYGDGPITGLAQHLGTDLSDATRGYDRVVLLIDDEQIGPFKLNGIAQGAADSLMPPTEQNFFASLQDLTAEGCSIDVWKLSHGTVDWAYDPATLAAVNQGGSIEALSDDDGEGDPDITTTELLEDTAPERSGTTSVPIVMTYGTPCHLAEWNDAWREVGAKVTAGAVDLNTRPQSIHRFAAAWAANQTYGAALSGEVSAFDEGLSFAYIEAQGLAPPFSCVGDSVLGTNACALDFFTDDDLLPFVDPSGVLLDGADEAKYAIGGPLWDLAGIAYDPAASGIQNMRAASRKVPDGDLTVRKNSLGSLRWP